MKKEFLITLISLIALNLMGQGKNIEVEVSDTIMCKIEAINYILTVEEGPGNELIKNYLIENKIPNKNKSYSRIKNYNEYHVRFNTWDEIEKLKIKLEKKSLNAQGIATGNEHELKDSEIERLYKKILERSREEANRIAKAMGKKLGEVIEVRYNNRESSKGGWTAYPPLSNISNPTIELPERNEEKMQKSRSLIVKYEIE